MSTLTAATAVTRIIRAVIYLRISKDKAGDEHGVINQRGDAERLSASRGYEVGAVYCDNDISAFSGARRPGYQAMMAAAARGEFDVIVLYQTSRLWRTRSERAAGIKILQAAGILRDRHQRTIARHVHGVRAGDGRAARRVRHPGG